jgi:hypothetical protein
VNELDLIIDHVSLSVEDERVATRRDCSPGRRAT